MAKGPKDEWRPDDAAAVRAVRIALGELSGKLDESATSANVGAAKHKTCPVVWGSLGDAKEASLGLECSAYNGDRQIAAEAAAAR